MKKKTRKKAVQRTISGSDSLTSISSSNASAVGDYITAGATDGNAFGVDDEFCKNVITVKSFNGDFAKYVIEWDANIDDFVHVLKSILWWMKFTNSTIEQAFCDPDNCERFNEEDGKGCSECD